MPREFNLEKLLQKYQECHCGVVGSAAAAVAVGGSGAADVRLEPLVEASEEVAKLFVKLGRLFGFASLGISKETNHLRWLMKVRAFWKLFVLPYLRGKVTKDTGRKQWTDSLL